MNPDGIRATVEQALGLIIVGGVLLDVFTTVLYARLGTGIISHRLARATWWVFRATANRLWRRRATILTFCGPVVLVVLVGFWILALTVGTVALSTRVAPHLAAAGLAVAWLGVSLRALAPRRDPLLAMSSPVLLTSALVLAAAVAVLVVRRRDLAEILRRTS